MNYIMDHRSNCFKVPICKIINIWRWFFDTFDSIKYRGVIAYILRGTSLQIFPQFYLSMRFWQTQGKCRLLWHNNSTHFTCWLFTKVASCLLDCFQWFYKEILFLPCMIWKNIQFCVSDFVPDSEHQLPYPVSHLCLHWSTWIRGLDLAQTFSWISVLLEMQ